MIDDKDEFELSTAFLFCDNLWFVVWELHDSVCSQSHFSHFSSLRRECVCLWLIWDLFRVRFRWKTPEAIPLK
jgi:hypothetical protein